jgi:hypothetical protein
MPVIPTQGVETEGSRLEASSDKSWQNLISRTRPIIPAIQEVEARGFSKATLGKSETTSRNKLKAKELGAWSKCKHAECKV